MNLRRLDPATWPLWLIVAVFVALMLAAGWAAPVHH